MKLRIPFIFVFALLSVSSVFTSVKAQITANVSSITFNPTNELSRDSIKVVIQGRNNSRFLGDIRLFQSGYKDSVFSVSKRTINVANFLQRDSFWVYFHPKHNLLFKSVLVIPLDITKDTSLAIQLTGQGVFSNSYYSGTQNLTEAQLRAHFRTLLGTNTTSLGYDNARDQLCMTLDNKATNGQGASVNTIQCLFTGRQGSNYTDRLNLQSQSNIAFSHAFPQSIYGQQEPMRSDLHQLFPVFNPAHTSRGTNAFGVATSPLQDSSVHLSSKLGANNLYEPNDSAKGRVARALMFFVSRYLDYSGWVNPQQAILRQWHNAYPPDSLEIKRNQAIFGLQNNRNPFIDYPQFNERITNLIGSTSAPVNYSLWWKEIDFTDNYTTSNNYCNFILVNNGNQAVTINSITSSDTVTLDFVSAFPVTIQPGEYSSFRYQYHKNPTNQNRSGLMTINTNIPNATSIQLPFYIGLFGSVADQLSANAPEIAIHSGEELSIRTKGLSGKTISWNLVDALGRNVKTLHSTDTPEVFEIDLSQLKRGLYSLGVNSGTYQKTFKVVKTH